MFFDLCVPCTSSPSRAIAETLAQLGWDGMAHTTVVEGRKLGSSDVCSITPTDLSHIVRASLPHRPLRIKKGQDDSFLQFTRLTVRVDDPAQLSALNPNQPAPPSYDVFAVQPTTEKLLQSVASSVECDIIQLDASRRLGFSLRFPTVGVAISRGIWFELCYSAALTDTTARRNFFSNAQSLIRVTRGKGIIFSSGALRAMDIRGPMDVANLAVLCGLGLAEATDAVSNNTRAVIMRGVTRRTYRSVVSIVPAVSEKGKEKLEES